MPSLSWELRSFDSILFPSGVQRNGHSRTVREWIQTALPRYCLFFSMTEQKLEAMVASQRPEKRSSALARAQTFRSESLPVRGAETHQLHSYFFDKVAVPG